MAKGYLPGLRDEPMLLPVDVRDWLPAGHVAWFVLDAVAAMDTAAVHRGRRLGGAGRAAYDPDMLLALLIYAYASGLRSSRKIEARCREDVAFMVVSGLRFPDHTTIARFRRDHDGVMEELFTQVLLLCARAGMGALEHVAIDGTKVAADASPSRSRDADGLRRVVRRVLDEAQATDAAEDAADTPVPGGLPPELADPERRRRVIADLLEQVDADPDPGRLAARRRQIVTAQRAGELLDELTGEAAAAAGVDIQAARRRVERAEENLARIRAEVQARSDEHAERQAQAAAQGRSLPGARPVPVAEHSHVKGAAGRAERARARLAAKEQATPEPGTAKRNLTDPDARFMPTRSGYLLGYNCQTAVSADHLILAVDVTNQPGDVEQLAGMLNRLETTVSTLRHATANPDLTIGTLLADAGYHSAANLDLPGPPRLIAQGKGHHPAGTNPPTDPPGPEATPTQQMAWQLNTPQGRRLYKKRASTVEPVNAHLKDQRGLRRFARRGHTAALAELRLAALTTNLMHLFTTTSPATN